MGIDFAKSLNTLLYHADIEKMCTPLPAENLNIPSAESSVVNTPKRTRKVKTIKRVGLGKLSTKKSGKTSDQLSRESKTFKPKPDENDDDDDDSG